MEFPTETIHSLIFHRITYFPNKKAAKPLVLCFQVLLRLNACFKPDNNYLQYSNH